MSMLRETGLEGGSARRDVGGAKQVGNHGQQVGPSGDQPGRLGQRDTADSTGRYGKLIARAGEQLPRCPHRLRFGRRSAHRTEGDVVGASRLRRTGNVEIGITGRPEQAPRTERYARWRRPFV